MNRLLAMILAIVTIVATLCSANIPTVSASGTYVDGHRAGKAQGHSDALNGYPASGNCGSGHSNDYCLGYKVGYNVEYYWTKLVQDRQN